LCNISIRSLWWGTLYPAESRLVHSLIKSFTSSSRALKPPLSRCPCFRGWVGAAPRVNAIPVELPGKATRMRERWVADFSRLCQQLAGEILQLAAGAPFALYGHSQGGITVSNIAADPAIQDRYNITTLLTAGSPTAGADIPDDVHALHLENTGDAVPGLDAAATPTGPHRQVAMLDTHQMSTNGYPHASSAYAQATEGLEGKAPELADWNSSFSRASGAGEQGARTTEYTFAIRRDTDSSGVYQDGAGYRGRAPTSAPSYERPTPPPSSQPSGGRWSGSGPGGGTGDG